MSIRACAFSPLLLLLPACQSTAAADFTKTDQAAIHNLDGAFEKMVMAADWSNLVRTYYAADAVVMPPNEGALVGHAQIEASFRNWPPVPSMVLKCETIGSGDLACSVGTYEMTITTPGGPVTDKGKCLAVFRRQPDGSWKSVRDIWNSDLPPAPSKQ